MRFLLFMLLSLWVGVGQAQAPMDVVEEGSWVVVIGAVQGCEQWDRRVLDVQLVQDDQPLELVGIPVGDVTGMSGIEIRIRLQAEGERLTGHKAESLKVLVFQLQLPREIIRMYGLSVRELAVNACPWPPILQANPVRIRYKGDIQELQADEMAEFGL